MDIFCGHHKIGLVLGSFLYILGPFFKVKGTELRYFFGVAKISNIFWGCLIIPDIFFGEQ